MRFRPVHKYRSRCSTLFACRSPVKRAFLSRVRSDSTFFGGRRGGEGHEAQCSAIFRSLMSPLTLTALASDATTAHCKP